MSAERLAMLTVVLCIGVLLLSACGLPLGPPPRFQPPLLAGNFAAYAPDRTLVASGHIDSAANVDFLRAQLTVDLPGCLNGQTVNLTGALMPTLTLHSAPRQGLLVTLVADTPPVYEPRAIRVLPFHGRLTLRNSCADQDRLVEVVPMSSPPQSVP